MWRGSQNKQWYINFVSFTSKSLPLFLISNSKDVNSETEEKGHKNLKDLNIFFILIVSVFLPYYIIDYIQDKVRYL